MGLFGWDLPPGCSMNDIDPPEGPCECCGKSSDHCTCPECPQCGCIGDPKCYKEHGLVYTQAQLDGQKALEEAIKAEIEAEKQIYPEPDMEQL